MANVQEKKVEAKEIMIRFSLARGRRNPVCSLFALFYFLLSVVVC